MPHLKKRNIIIVAVLVLFGASYARHRHEEARITVSGHLQSKDMNEISGIAASGLLNNIYYIHNDSGDTSRFFAITPDGKLKSTIYFKGDDKVKQQVEDCEDIAVGIGPTPGKSYVYMGDIGDNSAVRNYITVYRLEEKPTWLKGNIIHADAVPIHLKYPDGPKDAETLMVDPIQKLLYIVSKRRDTVNIYTSPLLFKPNDTVTMTKRCSLFFEGIKPFKWITAGDISRDGQQVLLKSYEKVYYWQRQKNEPVWETMQRKSAELPYQVEKQGEAIGFTLDGAGYYTTSEGVYSPIYYYKSPRN